MNVFHSELAVACCRAACRCEQPRAVASRVIWQARGISSWSDCKKGMGRACGRAWDSLGAFSQLAFLDGSRKTPIGGTLHSAGSNGRLGCVLQMSCNFPSVLFCPYPVQI